MNTISTKPGVNARQRPAWRRLAAVGPSLLGLTVLLSVVGLGISTDWRLPKFSQLWHSAPVESDEWCAEHAVPESLCVICNGTAPPTTKFGWCRIHGVAECPWCHPEVAQLEEPPRVDQPELARVAAALAAVPRKTNNSRCERHSRVIQFTSSATVERLGIETAPVKRAAVTDAVHATAELDFDSAAVAHVAARTEGTAWKVLKQVGERVEKGDVLALIDAAAVGAAKAEFQQALVDLDLKGAVYRKLQDLSGDAVAKKNVLEAQADVEEAEVRSIAARQALINLGLPVPEELRRLSAEELAQRMQFLGIPADVQEPASAGTNSSNLLPVFAPIAGEVIARDLVPGEGVDRTQEIFVIADPSRMWVTAHVRVEDVARVKIGQTAEFAHAGHDRIDPGRVAWISPAVDDQSRTVPVRIVGEQDQAHAARTFGTARIIIRSDPDGIVVPAAAVHWEGDCHVVFVRDKNYGKPGAASLFHVRKVRIGATAQNASAPGAEQPAPMTEIIAGVLPGEWIATTHSGLLRSELLRGELGEGEGHGHHHH